MAATFYKEKDPNAALDYTFYWGDYLGVKTIASATVAQPSGLTVSAPTTATPNVTVRITGGTAGTEYDVVCHVTLSTGEIDDRTLRLLIKDM